MWRNHIRNFNLRILQYIPFLAKCTYYKQSQKGETKNFRGKSLLINTTTDSSRRTQTVTLDQANRSHQAKATDRSRKKDHPNSRISTLVTIDTGSGINITHGRSLLLDYVEFKSPLTTYLGVGSEEHQMPIKLIGQGYFPLKYSATETIGIPALFYPDEDTTIISAMHLNRRLGVYLNLTYDHLVFPDRKISTVKAQDIVSVPLSEILSEVKGASTTKIRMLKEKYSPKTMSLYEAHVRPSHVNNQAIKDSVNAHVFDDIDHLTAGQNRGEKWREIRRGGKATRSFHYTNSMNAYTEIIQPGSSWSLDIFGSVGDLPSDADRYMLVIVGSVSRYLMVSTHKNKDEKTTVTQIQRNISYIERQFGRTVRVVVADQGTEFNNSLLKNSSWIMVSRRYLLQLTIILLWHSQKGVLILSLQILGHYCYNPT